MYHDEIVARLIKEYRIADQQKYVDYFLSGLSEHRISLGMAALAYMRHFPEHPYVVLEDYIFNHGFPAVQKQQKLPVLERKVITMKNLPTDLQEDIKSRFAGLDCYGYHCEICSGYYMEYDSVEKDIEEFWLNDGSLHSGNRLFLFLMEHTNSLEAVPKPSSEDYDIFQTILDCIQAASDSENIRDVLRKVKKQDFYKKWYKEIRKEYTASGKSLEYLSFRVEDKIQLILEMLGLCGVLHTEKKRAPFYEFDNLPMAQRSSPRSDWEPPVDFWRGKDGIDREAFEYWFGSQPYDFRL